MTTPVEFMDDGQVTVEIVSRNTGEKRQITYDPLLLLLTCEELEAKHQLPKASNGERTATVAFVVELAQSLADIGIVGCTPNLAVKLWQATSQAVDTVKKNTAETQSSPFGTEPEKTPAE